MYKSEHFSSFADIITHKSSLMCVIKIINGPIITYFFPTVLQTPNVCRHAQKIPESACVHLEEPGDL